MKIKLTIFILFLSLSFSIGLKALVIPQSASLLSTSGTGISNNYQVNPALLLNEKNHVSFSKNIWLGDVSGQKICLISKNKTYFSFETLSVSDIELRDEIANDTPIGFFGAYWYALEFNKAMTFKDDLNFGYKVKLNLSKLYTNSMRGYTLDLGLNKLISDNFSIGFLVKNIGKEYSSDLQVSNNPSYGLGINYNLDDYKIIVSSDLLNQDNENFIKLSAQTNLNIGLNFIFGLTHSKSYKDFSVGLRLDLGDWSIVYGNLSHDNTTLGNPSSIEIKKYF